MQEIKRVLCWQMFLKWSKHIHMAQRGFMSCMVSSVTVLCLAVAAYRICAFYL